MKESDIKTRTAKRQILAFIFAFVICALLHTATAQATEYQETVWYYNESTGRIASGDINLASGDKVTTTADSSNGIDVSGASGDANIANVDITTSGKSADGASAASGGQADITGGKITTTGEMGYGLSANGTNSAITADNVDIKTSGDHGHGVAAIGGGRIDITGGKITTTGSGGYGINAESGSSVVISGDADISLLGGAGRGIYAKGNGTKVEVTGNTKITSAGNNEYGVFAEDKSQITLNGVSLDVGAAYGANISCGAVGAADNGIVDIFTNAGGWNEIKARGRAIFTKYAGALVNIQTGTSDTLIIHGATQLKDNDVIDSRNGSTIHSDAIISADTTTNDSDILRAGYGGHASYITLSNDLVGLTRGATASVVMSTNTDATGSRIVIDGNMTAETLGNNTADGIKVEDISSVIVGKNADIITRGNGSHGLHTMTSDGGKIDIAGNANILTEGADSRGAYAEVSSDITVGGSMTINTQGGNAHGAEITNGAALTAGTADITTKGASANALMATQDSTITIGGGTVTAEGTGSRAMVMKGTADGTKAPVISLTNVTASAPASGILLEASEKGTLNATSSKLTGDIFHTGGAANNLTVNLNGSTTLTGAMHSPAIDVDMDATSTWNVTADSNPDGVFNNAGTINFGANVSDGFKDVRVSDYNGTAATSKLFMKTDINSAADTDQIHATNQATGGSDITIYNTANAGVERSKALLLADNGGGSVLNLTHWDEETGGVKYIHAGAWKYSLVKEATASGGEEWFLKRGDKLPPHTPTPEDPDPLRPIGLTTTGQAIVAAGFLHDVWYTETNTWNKRMGIYRDNTWDGGFWISAVMNREDFDREHTNTVADRQDFSTGTIGFDKKYKVQNGDFWGGIMAGYGKTDNDLYQGIGDVDMKSYHMSLYGVYRMTNGFYVNGIVKYNHYESDLTITRPDNFSKYILGFDNIKGEWNQEGLGVSLQAGKRFDFKSDKGWYWEPQVQLSWNRVFSAGYTTDSGIDVEVDDTDYIRFRGGIVLGRSWTLGNGTLLDLYADASIIHDFDADTRVTISGGEYTATLGGTWGIYGIGANWQFKPGKFFHARFQYSDGEPFTEPFAIYMGLSFEM